MNDKDGGEDVEVKRLSEEALGIANRQGCVAVVVVAIDSEGGCATGYAAAAVEGIDTLSIVQDMLNKASLTVASRRGLKGRN